MAVFHLIVKDSSNGKIRAAIKVALAKDAAIAVDDRIIPDQEFVLYPAKLGLTYDKHPDGLSNTEIHRLYQFATAMAAAKQVPIKLQPWDKVCTVSSTMRCAIR